MKKSLLVLAVLGVVAGFAASASAQSVLWMDIRDNTATGTGTVKNQITVAAPTRPFIYTDAGAVVSGARGYGQVVYIEPVRSTYPALPPHPNANAFPNLDLDSNRYVCNAFLYIDVNDDASGTGDVMSSIGVDMTIDETAAGNKNRVQSLSYDWEAMMDDQTNEGAANGAQTGTPPATPPSWAGAKAVKVPVVDGTPPTFANAGGLLGTAEVGQANPYRIGKLVLSSDGAPRGTCSAGNATRSTYSLWLTTNNLKITRVFDTGGDADEQIAFGYAGGAVDTWVTNPTGSSGNNSGLRSDNADLVVKAWAKGDFTGDGRSSGPDTTPYLAAAAAVNDGPDKTFRGDFTGDGQVTGADTTPFLVFASTHSACP